MLQRPGFSILVEKTYFFLSNDENLFFFDNRFLTKCSREKAHKPKKSWGLILILEQLRH